MPNAISGLNPTLFSQPAGCLRPDPRLSGLILFWLHFVMLRYWFTNYPYCSLRRAGGRVCVNCALRLWCPVPNQLPSTVFLKQFAGTCYPLEHWKTPGSPLTGILRCFASGLDSLWQNNQILGISTVVVQCSCFNPSCAIVERGCCL